MLLPKRRKPTHPGIILNEEFLKPLEMTPKKFAKLLGSKWTELKVQSIINGKEAINEEMAEAFASLLNTTADFWMVLQRQCTHYDSTKRRNEKGSIKRLKKAG